MKRNKTVTPPSASRVVLQRVLERLDRIERALRPYIEQERTA